MGQLAEIGSGYLIVKTFERMYREFAHPAESGESISYSIPRVGVEPSAVPKRYHGMSRDPLEAWTSDELERGYPNIPTPIEDAACLAMAELESVGKGAEDFIFSPADAAQVFGLLRQPGEWELIWCSQSALKLQAPVGTAILGYEPTWWTGDHFSAVMDSMCFPRWHGPGPDLMLLVPFYDRLNSNALFQSTSEADEFLTFYRAQPWAESGTYVIAEIRGSSYVG